MRGAETPRTAVVPDVVPEGSATHVAIFVENRNGVRIAAALHDTIARVAAVTLITADADSDVAHWVESEVSEHSHLAGVRNLAEEWGVRRHEDVRPALIQHLPGFLADEGIDRVVVFNDQSVRGSAVIEGAHGVPAVLIQDGTLEFVVRVTEQGLGDQNARYGTSSVARICVWGQEGRKRVLEARGDLSVPDIRVTGSVLHSGLDDLAVAYEHRGRIRRSGRPRDPLNVLLLDQPLAAQRKTSVARHRAMLTELAAAVAPVGSLTIKPHPSSNAAHLAFLDSIPGATVMSATEPLSATGLRAAEVTVTWFSTAYVDTMRAGVPLVAIGDPRVALALPALKSELLRNVGSIDEAQEVFVEMAEVGQFRGNATGVVPDTLLRINADVVSDVADAVVEPIAAAGEDVPVPAREPVERSARRDAALASLRNATAPTMKIAVLGERFIQSVGVSLPVMAMARHMASTAEADVRLIDVMEYHSVDAILAELQPDEIVVINSLRPFWVKRWLPDLVTELRARGRTPFVYAHETRAVVEREHAAFRSQHQRMLPALAKSVVLCVSAAQATMFEEMGARATRVIYNTSPGVVPTRLRERTAPARATVVMVGSVQTRKGADWFSRAADLAHERRLPMDFVWVGGGQASVYRSPAVQWKGHLPRRLAERIVRDADVFLLSSVDDPMPLSALEAIAAGVRVVAYEGVGSHEVLEGVRGYASYSKHDPELMLGAIESVLESTIDPSEYEAIVDTFSVEAFTERMLTVLSEDAAAASSARDVRAASTGGVVSVKEVHRAVRAERFEQARVLTRQVLRNRPTPEAYSTLAKVWLSAGERDYALALLRTGYLLSNEGPDFRAAIDVTFASEGISARQVDRWTLRNATIRGWRRVRPLVDGERR